jgi:endogenous inhibitor of DNA gyrase (YacG/DUF329 family)
MIDLGKWADGDYYIAGGPSSEAEQEGQERRPQPFSPEPENNLNN